MLTNFDCHRICRNHIKIPKEIFLRFLKTHKIINNHKAWNRVKNNSDNNKKKP